MALFRDHDDQGQRQGGEAGIIRLALLAPDIVEAILGGKQAASLALKNLMAAFPLERSGENVRSGIGDGRVQTPQS